MSHHTGMFLYLYPLLCNTFPLKGSQNRLIFYDNHYGQLDYFIHGIKRHTDRKKSLARKQAQTYNALTTSNNEVLIFPAGTEVSLCRQICMTFKQALNR